LQKGSIPYDAISTSPRDLQRINFNQECKASFLASFMRLHAPWLFNEQERRYAMSGCKETKAIKNGRTGMCPCPESNAIGCACLVTCRFWDQQVRGVQPKAVVAAGEWKERGEAMRLSLGFYFFSLQFFFNHLTIILLETVFSPPSLELHYC